MQRSAPPRTEEPLTSTRGAIPFVPLPSAVGQQGDVALSIASTVPKKITTTTTSLEEKLELLEPRFTEPSAPAATGIATTTAAVPPPSGVGALGDHNHNTSSSVLSLSPHRNVGANGGSYQYFPHQQDQTSRHSVGSMSQHSFGFDTPSLSNFAATSMTTAAAAATENNRNSSNYSFLSARAKPKSQSKLSPVVGGGGLAAVQRATERHLAKVTNATSGVRVGSDSPSFGQTTIHAYPPPPSENMSTTTPNVASGDLNGGNGTRTRDNMAAMNASPQSKTKKNPRKSIPVKRECATVKETCSKNNTKSNPSTAISNVKGNNKNPRVGNATSTSSSVSATNSKRQRENIATVVTDGHASNAGSSESAISGTATIIAHPSNSNSPKPTTKAQTTNANNGGGSASKKKRQRKNRRITSFFTSVNPTTSTAINGEKQTNASAESELNASLRGPSTSPVSPSLLSPTTAVQQVLSSSSDSNNTAQLVVQQLQLRIEELQRDCQEKHEQLQAVHNNRTILHSALQSALKERQNQIVELQKQMQSQREQSAYVLETWIRDDSTRQATTLREKLAADSARLGRIVTMRTGLRTIERWEDGHASKHLREKKEKLQQRIREMQQRYDTAMKVAEQLTAKTHGRPDSISQVPMAPPPPPPPSSLPIAGIVVQTRLEANEAVESARFHLDTLRRQQEEIDSEETLLQDEKLEHIRAVKRVALEDASRFRSRPKLNDRYILRSLLGKGGFSEVWCAYDLIELREVAVKIHQLDPRWSDAKKENYTKHVSREYEIHRNVRHPRIVSLYDVFEIDNNSFATVLECCNGTDLDTLLKQKKKLSEGDARAILLQILLGMQYLSRDSPDGSRQGIIHYDLKPGNILFDEHGDAKITDFGLSKIVDNSEADSMELTSQGAGTYWYLPPECFILDDTVRISNKVDVWSIGVIMYQMLFGRRPFGDGMAQDKLLSNNTMLHAREVFIPEEPKVSNSCKQFLRACLTYEQSERPTIAQLCEHEYVLQPT